MTKILFVCLGNICRSPMAEGLLKKRIASEGKESEIFVDSAATSTYEVGKFTSQWNKENFRTNENVDTTNMVARQITEEDFESFDWIIGMDQYNVEELKRRAPRTHKIKSIYF